MARHVGGRFFVVANRTRKKQYFNQHFRFFPKFLPASTQCLTRHAPHAILRRGKSVFVLDRSGRLFCSGSFRSESGTFSHPDHHFQPATHLGYPVAFRPGSQSFRHRLRDWRQTHYDQRARRRLGPANSDLITTFSQQPTWDTPWRFDQVRKASGTGFVIGGKRIMTNAHVVDWGRQILVRRYQDPRPYIARVKFFASDCDLAILEVDDERFFNGMQALEFGDLPQVRSTVVTYGYPAGGEQISYTRGVVSRIELQNYVHIGNRSYLAAQTDAAINPGNSGGPVIQDDKVVGVAFQGISGLENTGFFIPTTLVQHLLKDIEDGTYDGFPQAGIRFVSLQNDAYRKFLGLEDNDLGARIDHIF